VVFIVFVGAKSLAPSGANPGYGQVSQWNKITLKFEHNIKLSAASFKQYLTETAFKTQEDG